LTYSTSKVLSESPAIMKLFGSKVLSESPAIMKLFGSKVLSESPAIMKLFGIGDVIVGYYCVVYLIQTVCNYEAVRDR